MEAEREDGRQKMHFLEEELTETRKKSAETVAETRCDACRQISEMEDKVYKQDDKAEETRHDIIQQAEDIIDEEKNNVKEVHQLASSKMSDMMEQTEEKTAEVRQVTRRKIADMEEKAVNMALEMRRATRCMKSETKK